MKILLTRTLTDAVMRDVADLNADIRSTNVPLTVAEAAEALATYDFILPTLGDAFGAAAFAGEIRCKGLANFGVGYNHIDVAAAKAAGLVVSNTPGAVTEATADIAMMLLLMSARRAGEGERMVRAGAWEGWHPTQMLGHHVSGKRVGIVGYGRIGKAIARRCHFGFGMEVQAFTRSPITDQSVPVTQVDSLSALMAAVDFVVIAVPAGAATHHIINAAALAAMQPHAHLINISRGDVIDEAALVDTLQSGRIGGAGLDVYEFEPKVPEALLSLDWVTLLPHLGTATEEVRTDMGRMAVANLRAMIAGTPPPNAV